MSWWQWTNRSLSLQEIWSLTSRAVGGAGLWAVPAFVFIAVCPRVLTGPLVSLMAGGGTDCPDGGGEPGDVYDGQPSRARRVWAVIADTAASWWVWTDRSESISEVWRSSWGVKPRRIPAWAPGWVDEVWIASNIFDRTLVWFPLILIGPRFVTGPLIWLVARPTRRAGAWVVVALLSIFFSAMEG